MEGRKRMTSREYVENYEKLNMEIIGKTIETNQLIKRLKDAAENTTTQGEGERVQSSGSVDKMANAIVAYTYLEEELKQFVAERTAQKNEILETIRLLSMAEYDLLLKVYVRGFTLKELQVMKKCSYSNVTTLHGYALNSLQRILDEREKADN